MTDFDDIQLNVKKMLEIMDENKLEEFELERNGVRVRLRKPVRTSVQPREKLIESVEPISIEAPKVDIETAGEDTSLISVKSPIVGTFYRAADPTADPFVEVGSLIRKGQVLCIIEAMKLMNKIDSEHEGEVVEILVENGQPIQFGELLFKIRPS